MIEDEEGLRTLMRRILEEKGYTVLTASDGIEAIETYTKYERTIHLVLSDVGLPRLDGSAVIATLRDINPNLVCILASGFIEPNQKSEMYKSGVKAIIQKPYVPGEVLMRVREALDERR